MNIIYLDGSWMTLASKPYIAGEFISKVKASLLQKVDRDKYSVQLGDSSYRVPGWSYLNHSCNPSCSIQRINDTYILVAEKCLAPGDELTFDYRINESEIAEPFDCLCGAVNCEKKIK